MKFWFKEWKNHHLLRDVVIIDDSNDSRTHKVFHATKEAANQLDVATPLWLDTAIASFKRSAKARFTQDAFMEPIDFDYLEIEVIEEDYTNGDD